MEIVQKQGLERCAWAPRYTIQISEHMTTKEWSRAMIGSCAVTATAIGRRHD
jgi:hypothetical protein